MNIFGRTVSVLIAGFLVIAVSGCGEQKKKAEERGRNVTQPLKDAQKEIDAATAKIQEKAKDIEREIEDASRDLGGDANKE